MVMLTILTFAVAMVIIREQRYIWKQRNEYGRLIVAYTVRINGIEKLMFKMDQDSQVPKNGDWGNSGNTDE